MRQFIYFIILLRKSWALSLEKILKHILDFPGIRMFKNIFCLIFYNNPELKKGTNSSETGFGIA
jgi:hypothetical protein